MHQRSDGCICYCFSLDCEEKNYRAFCFPSWSMILFFSRCLCLMVQITTQEQGFLLFHFLWRLQKTQTKQNQKKYKTFPLFSSPLGILLRRVPLPEIAFHSSFFSPLCFRISQSLFSQAFLPLFPYSCGRGGSAGCWVKSPGFGLGWPGFDSQINPLIGVRVASLS